MGEGVSAAGRRKARRFAVQALYQWQMAGADIAEIEAWFRSDNDLRKTDTAYFHDLLVGVTGRVTEIDAALAPVLDRAVESLGQVEKAVLRIGTFELMARVDVPRNVVINEGIELVRLFGAEESFRYINGVLDKLAGQLRTSETGSGA